MHKFRSKTTISPTESLVCSYARSFVIVQSATFNLIAKHEIQIESLVIDADEWMALTHSAAEGWIVQVKIYTQIFPCELERGMCVCAAFIVHTVKREPYSPLLEAYTCLEGKI